MLTVSMCGQVLAESRSAHVVLLPPTLINSAGSDWVSDSLLQSLQADLHHATFAHVSAPIATDADALAKLAHNAAADYLIQPHAQFSTDSVRLTAEIYNDAGQQIGSAKTTGEMKRLFDVEDAMAGQLQEIVDRAAAMKHPTTAPAPTVSSVGPLMVSPIAAVVPVGTVPVAYSSQALRDGRDRSLYQIPVDGCLGYGGFGPYGYFGFGGACGYRCGGIPANFNGASSAGGAHTLSW
jgi:hypothetical protein